MFRHPIYRQRQIARFARLLPPFDPVSIARQSHNSLVHNPGQESHALPQKATCTAPLFILTKS